MLDVAHEARADHVQGAGLRRQHRLAVQVAQHQRADAQRIAHADQFLVGQRHQGVAALDLTDRVDEPVDDPRLPRTGDQMKDDLAVRGRLEDRALGDQLFAQGQEIGQVAVMGEGHAAGFEIGEHRLDVADAAWTLRMPLPPAVA